MKKVAILILAVLLPLTCVTAPSRGEPETEELMDRFMTGLGEENIDVLMGTYWPDAEMVMTLPDGNEFHFKGIEQIRKLQLEGFQDPARRNLEFGKPEGEVRGSSATYRILVQAPAAQVLNRFELARRDERWGIIRQVVDVLPPEQAEADEIRVNSSLQSWVDRNGTGVLEPPEFEELKGAMMHLVREPHYVKNPLDEMFDWNGDGYIDRLEQRSAGMILICEQLRRLPLIDPDIIQLFEIEKNDYIQFWETEFVYSIVAWKNVWPQFANRVDADRNGEVNQREIDEYVDLVYRVLARLPLNPDDATMYRWRGKQALFEWSDINGDGEIGWLELQDLGKRVTDLVDFEELPYPLNSSLADYFDRNRDGSISKAETDTMRQIIVLEQLDRLFDPDISYRDRPLMEILDLNGNGRFDETEKSMLLELFDTEPGFIRENRTASTALDKGIDTNGDGVLETWENHIFEMAVMGTLAIAWMRAPVQEVVSIEGWAVHSLLDELADLNGDGFIDRSEDRQMAEGLGTQHPVRTAFDLRIDFNGNGQVETFEIVKARRIGESIEQAEEAAYPVRTIMDDHLDLNGDGQVEEVEVDRVLRFLRGETALLERRSKLYRVFDLNNNGTITEAELVRGIDLYLLPRPVNPEELFDGQQDSNRDGFVAPEEIGIAAGVSARGNIPTIPERLERLEWVVDRESDTTMVEKPESLERYESEFYTKLGRIRDQKLAVVGITSRTRTIDEETASGVMVFIENAFVNVGKVRVVDRENIAKIVKEYEFQGSDLTDESTAVEIGKLSGADIIVIGSISYVGEIYYLNIKLISVETAEIIGSSIADAVSAKEFYEMCNDAVFKLF